jgi:rhodanese-related sulfurtransferase
MIGQWNTDQGVITANAGKYELLDELEINNVMIAKQIHDSGTALFVDARQQESFDDGHIPGAVSLPVGRFDDYIDSFMSEYLPAQPIVVYCSGRTCEDSHQLAQLLIGFGFTDVRVFIDGFPGWESKGYEVE